MTYDIVTSRLSFGCWESVITETDSYVAPAMALDTLFEEKKTGKKQRPPDIITRQVDRVTGFTRWGTNRKGIRRMLRIVNNEYKREQSRVRMRYERRDSGNINAERKLQR